MNKILYLVYSILLFPIFNVYSADQIYRGMPGLIWGYHLNDGAGGSAIGVLQNTSSATLTSTSWVTNGLAGPGIKFTAQSGQTIRTSLNGAGFNGKSEITYIFWIYFDVISANNYFMDTYDGAGRNVQIVLASNGRIDANFTDTSGTTGIGITKPLETKKWYNVAFTWKQNDKAIYYVNGVIFSTKAVTTNAVLTTRNRMAYLFNDQGTGNAPLSIVDEIYGFERALSQGEIQAIYNKGRGKKVWSE